MNNKLARVTSGLIALVLAGVLIVWFAREKEAGAVGVKHEMTNLAAGLAHFHAVFGHFPTGNNAQVAAALRGNNPEKLVIDPIGPRRMNKWDELWDIWDTPYRFDFASNSTITVSSAGKNKLFGDDDDLVVRVSLDDTNFPFIKNFQQPTNTPPQE